MKKCIKCMLEKEETEFYRDRTTKDGLRTDCKLCNLSRNKVYYKRNQLKNLLVFEPPQTKICSKCKVERSSDHFNKSTMQKDGLQSRCRICFNDERRYYLIENGESRECKKRRKDINTRIKSNNSGWINSLIKQSKVLNRPTEFTCAMDGCINQSNVYHHIRYDSRSTEQPFSIITPLCRDCHSLFHIREKEGVDLTYKILMRIELEYIPRKPPHIRIISENIT